MTDITLASIVPAFLVGLASFFLSICVLPLVPAFLAFIAGTTSEELKTHPLKAKTKILINTIGFVLGLAFFFSLLGVLFQSALASVSYTIQIYLNYFFGALIIIFGLMMTGLLKIPFLEKERKLHVHPKGTTFIKSFIFGAAFAVGWTPCSSPFLGLVLGFAATNPLQAFPILFAYSLGLGFPFLLTGVFITRSQKIFNTLTPYLQKLNFWFGILFIVLGVLIFTGKFTTIINSIIPQDFVLWVQNIQTAVFS